MSGGLIRSVSIAILLNSNDRTVTLCPKKSSRVRDFAAALEMFRPDNGNPRRHNYLTVKVSLCNVKR